MCSDGIGVQTQVQTQTQTQTRLQLRRKRHRLLAEATCDMMKTWGGCFG